MSKKLKFSALPKELVCYNLSTSEIDQFNADQENYMNTDLVIRLRNILTGSLFLTISENQNNYIGEYCIFQKIIPTPKMAEDIIDDIQYATGQTVFRVLNIFIWNYLMAINATVDNDIMFNYQYICFYINDENKMQIYYNF